MGELADSGGSTAPQASPHRAAAGPAPGAAPAALPGGAGAPADDGAQAGLLALRDLALSWLSRQDPLRLAGEEARALAQALGITCFVALCGQGGVTAVRVCQPGQGVSVGVAEGALFDLESSATGRVFAAWQDPPSRRLPAAVRRGIRSRGLAMVEGEHVPGINAISVPVFDAQGHLLLALTLVGVSRSLREQAQPILFSARGSALWKLPFQRSKTRACERGFCLSTPTQHIS